MAFKKVVKFKVLIFGRYGEEAKNGSSGYNRRVFYLISDVIQVEIKRAIRILQQVMCNEVIIPTLNLAHVYIILYLVHY